VGGELGVGHREEGLEGFGGQALDAIRHAVTMRADARRGTPILASQFRAWGDGLFAARSAVRCLIE
jgi:hypothetical protein